VTRLSVANLGPVPRVRRVRNGPGRIVPRNVLMVLAAALLSITAPPSGAQVLRKNLLPEQEGVGIVERRGEQVPLDLIFKDSFGKTVRLGDYFDGTRPVILVMAYYTCPLLCTKVLNEVQATLNQLKWTAGDQFRIVTISFDHRNTKQEARTRQQTYLSGYAREVNESAWPFLTGDVENIRALATAVGFHYKFLPDQGEFSHPSSLIFLTPTGKVNTYLERMDFPVMEVRLALSEAAEGRVGSIFDRVVAFCFVYDHTQGKHTIAAQRIMMFGGVAIMIAVGSFIGVMARSRSRHAEARASSTAAHASSPDSALNPANPRAELVSDPLPSSGHAKA